jgi:cobalt-zinc-cadmium efflux system outer membrane protein
LVKTYRFYQTAAYRRERYRLAQQLADFNDRLLESLQRQLEARQSQVSAADVALARDESRATRQQVKAARQDYLTALADLRNQIGIPEGAGAAEPLGEFSLPPYIPPVDEQTMVQTALANRPDIHAAQAQVAGTCSAVRLAKGDRIPTPVVGPQYEMDEAGVQYIGFVYIQPLPIWNNGKPLVVQREAEHRARSWPSAAQRRAAGPAAVACGMVRLTCQRLGRPHCGVPRKSAWSGSSS